MDSGFDVWDTVVGAGAMLAVPAYFVLQPWMARTFHGAWRVAAMVPLIFAVPIIIWCLLAFADRSNLWPLPFLLFAPFGTIYLLAVFTLRRVSEI